MARRRSNDGTAAREGVRGAESEPGKGSDASDHDARHFAEGDVLTIDGAAELLGVGRNALYDACGRGAIPHRRIGKLIRFSRVGLLRWLEGRTA